MSQVRHLLTPTCIDELFRKLGTSGEALEIERPVVPTLHLRQSKPNDRVYHDELLIVLQAKK